MKLSIIVAQSKNRVIGKNNQLPWHLPADLAYFKKMTIGKPIVMGRKTFESIGKPLPLRRNVVISSNPDFVCDGCELFLSLEAALEALKNEAEVMIIGGSNLYSQCIDRANTVYMTQVDVDCAGDAFFPQLSAQQWRLVSQIHHQKDDKNEYGYIFQCFERVS